MQTEIYILGSLPLKNMREPNQSRKGSHWVPGQEESTVVIANISTLYPNPSQI